jgi:hypothetical protein
MNARALRSRVGRMERATGMSPPCPVCHGVGCRSVVIVHARLNVVEHRGCARCGKLPVRRGVPACR